jgi:rapamycin-insensitive companion of mTOR
VLIDIDLVSRTGGILFLLHVLGDGPIELTSILAAAFLHIVDSPGTRAYLRVGVDLEVGPSPPLLISQFKTSSCLDGVICRH